MIDPDAELGADGVGLGRLLNEQNAIAKTVASLVSPVDLEAIRQASALAKTASDAAASYAHFTAVPPIVDMGRLTGPAGLGNIDFAALVGAVGLPNFDFADIAGISDISKDLALQNAEWLAAIQPSFFKDLVPDFGALLAPALFEGLQEMISSQMTGLFSGLDWELLRLRTLIPANWPSDFESHLPAIARALNDEGLPLAWVPRTEVFLLLVNASGAEERLEILREHRDEVLEDCSQIVESIEDDVIAGQIPVARQVIEACRNGMWMVAAIAAVSVVHTIVELLEWPTNHQGVAKHHTFDPTRSSKGLGYIESATRGPFVAFYSGWSPQSGKPQPPGLARNAVSHRVTDSHLNEHNCLIAVMLMASLMETVWQLSLGRADGSAAA